mmetsp:Transcript_2836/g.5625  ORF Transcript_2836/g.5625 Transcript_2836/m.5625 type:complete len:268 (+) Transcript_2836:525-1328(+)
MKEANVIFLQVRVEGLVQAVYELLKLKDHPLNPWLGGRVVVLYAIEQLGQAEEAVRLHLLESLLVRQVLLRQFRRVYADPRGQEHDEERHHEVVDALNVAARGVPDAPDVQDALQQALHGLVLQQLHARQRPRRVEADLVHDLVLRRAEPRLVLVVERPAVVLVLAPPLRYRRPAARAVGRLVAEGELPGVAADGRAEARPGALAQGPDVERGLVDELEDLRALRQGVRALGLVRRLALRGVLLLLLAPPHPVALFGLAGHRRYPCR